MTHAQDGTHEDADLCRTASLARGVQRGDTALLEQLYLRTAPALHAWVSLRAPRDVDPGDVLGEVWLRAIARLETHDSENHEFRAWIFGIAKHVLLQVLRARSSRGGASLGAHATGDLARTGFEAVPDSVTSVSRRLAREEVTVRFLDYARGLDAADRDLLVYCGLEGSGCSEVATRLGIGEEAARKRWQRMRTDLRGKPWVRDLLLDAG